MRARGLYKKIETGVGFPVIFLLIRTGAALHAEDVPFTLKVDVSLVSLDVAVHDLPGNPVSGLTPKDFIVTEDGTPQELRHFEPSDAPYNSLLLFDVSGSTLGQFPFMLEAANKFLGNLRWHDSIAIASFNTTVTKLLDWRTRQGTFQQVPVAATGGGTDLYSALRWGAVELGRQSGRKGVIILTDGYDHRMFSPQTAAVEERDFQAVLKVVEESRSPFYFVAFNASQKKAVERLQTLAEHSGGRVLFAKTLEELASLYQGIARELTASYRLSYHSSRPQADGTYRRIQVAVHFPGFRITQSKSGYWANGGKTEERISRAPQPRPTATAITQQALADVPVLVTPIDQALLSSPEKDAWRFNWEEVSNTTRYEIQINDPTGAPLLDSESRGTSFVFKNPVHAERNPKRWNWRVRAQIANGAWGPWSELRSFEVFQEKSTTSERSTE